MVNQLIIDSAFFVIMISIELEGSNKVVLLPLLYFAAPPK